VLRQAHALVQLCMDNVYSRLGVPWYPVLQLTRGGCRQLSVPSMPRNFEKRQGSR
jgi:hypothetical protein